MKKIILIIISIIIPCVSINANLGYKTPELKHLLTTLQIQEDSLGEGINYISVRNRALHIDVKQNVVIDMGYVIFSKEIKAAVHTPILNFLERYFLQLDYPMPDHTSKKMMQEDRFYFITGNTSTVGMLQPTDEFSYNYEMNNYEAAWRRDGETILSVKFPADHQLISGMDKITAEINFQNEAMATTIPAMTEIDERLLKPTKQNGYYIKEGSSYLNDNLNSDLFYTKQEGTFRLLSSVSHPLESAANMMIGTEYNTSFNLKVTQIMYGFKKKIYELPLNNWIAFCRNTGCTLYYGVESFNQQEIKATVIAVNTAENYNHLLFVNIPLSAIDSGKGDIDAKLETFIPMHNVLSIFAKYRRVKHSETKIFEQ